MSDRRAVPRESHMGGWERWRRAIWCVLGASLLLLLYLLLALIDSGFATSRVVQRFATWAPFSAVPSLMIASFVSKRLEARACRDRQRLEPVAVVAVFTLNAVAAAFVLAVIDGWELTSRVLPVAAFVGAILLFVFMAALLIIGWSARGIQILGFGAVAAGGVCLAIRASLQSPELAGLVVGLVFVWYLLRSMFLELDLVFGSGESWIGPRYMLVTFNGPLQGPARFWQGLRRNLRRG